MITRLALPLRVMISLFAAGLIFKPTQAASLSEPEMHLALFQETAIAGARTLWHLTLEPIDSQPIEALVIQSIDGTLWRQAQPLASPTVITQSKTLVVPMVPVRSGKLTPALRVSYRVGGDQAEVMIQAETAVDVHPVSDYVEVKLLSEQQNVRVGDVMHLTVWVRNRTPFTLSDGKMIPLVSGLDWQPRDDPLTLGPHETIRLPLTATVETSEPHLHFEFAYRWSDDLGNTRQEVGRVQGPLLETEPRFWMRIPTELLAIFLGVIASVLTTGGASIAEILIERKMQKNVKRRRALGLLNLILTKAAHSVRHGETLDLEFLEMLLKEEALYAVLGRYRLVDDVQRLWRAGELHNRNLTTPEGLHRATDLEDCLRTLKDRIRPLLR